MMRMQRGDNSDLQLSGLGLGCWRFGGGEYWGNQSQTDVNRTVRRAWQLGVNYFDTAEVYNHGRSETSLGAAIRGLPRDQMIVGTKISPSHARPATLLKHCEASLRRLGTDYIDLYMVHWPIYPHSIRHFTDDENTINNPPGVESAFETLIQLQQQGKIRHIGVSNFGVETLDESMATEASIVANELPYGLLCRAIEHEILPHCRNRGVAVIGYMTLMQGLLADTYSTLDEVPVWRRRTRHFSSKRSGDLCRHGQEGAEEETNQAMAGIRSVAAEHGMTMAEIAIKWALAAPGIDCVLVGARNEPQLEANVKAASEPLPEELVKELDEATQPLKEKLGPSFDYYEHPSNDRTLLKSPTAEPT